MALQPCNVIYVDRNVREDRTITKDGLDSKNLDNEWESHHIAENVKLLSNVFGEVHLCSTGASCLNQWLELQDVSMVDLKPTLILIDTPFHELLENIRSRSPSPHSHPKEDSNNPEQELYGLALLERIAWESSSRPLPKLVVLVPIIQYPLPALDHNGGNDGPSDMREDRVDGRRHLDSANNYRVVDKSMMEKHCIDLGATDVMGSPMNANCIGNLRVAAHRAQRDTAREQTSLLEVRRGRKRSWVGFTQERPFAYLREAMVSNLMGHICRVEDDGDVAIGHAKMSVPAERLAEISLAVGEWHFCAHDYSDDELIIAAACMFDHALSDERLKEWRIPKDQLFGFLIACRAAYNDFVPYHNFRHVVDVLQATFSFLIRVGALVAYAATNNQGSSPATKSPIASLLGPFEALSLLVTAIGHDVGHPGVNNGFLVTLNAPLAQLYNDRSVLESFHCAAYSQILRRHWPAAFGCKRMRNLMISSILATDMGLHFDYMKKLKDLQQQLQANETTIQEWNERTKEEYTALACALLIKCADISNVTRRHETAIQWMNILSEEFERQAVMEDTLAIATSLMATPKKDLMSLAKAQLSFMNLFALPLFQGVADILPPMQYCVQELNENKRMFENYVADERSKDESAFPKLLERLLGKNVPPPITPKRSEETVSIPNLAGIRSSTEKEFLTRPAGEAEKPSHVPELSAEYKEVNRTTYDDAVADFARSDPFNVNSNYGENDGKTQCPTRQQRHSETTEGSSAPYSGSGEWDSQATSATTGKMPLSPSTQGTSLDSRRSLDRPDSVPVTTITAAESTSTAPEPSRSQPDLKVDHEVREDLVNGYADHPHADGMDKGLEAEPGAGKTLMKKTSRFRLAFWNRKNKSPSPQLQATDTAG